MTIQERADDYVSVMKPEYQGVMRVAYSAGANEQYEIDKRDFLENASKAFCVISKCNNRVNQGCWKRCSKLAELRQAMLGDIPDKDAFEQYLDIINK